MSLSDDARAQYTTIIDSILAKSDLNTISEKRIRKGLEEAVGYDLTPQKAALKQLIMERFDLFADKGGATTPESAPQTANGTLSPHKRQAENAESPDRSEPTPPNKKPKPDNDVDADAIFAAKLQAEENMRARTTRGSSTRKTAPVKKKSKSKTSKKVKAEDDSDLESNSEAGPKKEVNRSGGFHKPLRLTPALSELLGGETLLSRPQTVKRLWQYIREHNLQDPSDRRQIRCDDAMRAVFRQDRVHMFTMTKILNNNLYNPEE
ncbi:hypothetical protein ASPZODRAFT_1176386 [Penicilliopsis zonata CBS 506.65]|uniref:Uncharacterized protein n=1 Tax=Penicilliopsis zonata CBS 506.65 TaxID=1073090 RepID=A0A1L9S7T5_9EURO|nr:hypothetical protein ASPZODRAFT_1176386 [Penicilliopsis zonata CBS 506.65]OJJ43222.1 hypothetical protein ASPZODRAFT_1176386 [Penicilliopsis zonata CBS 506.65]